MRKKDYNKKDIEKIIAIGKQKGYLTYDEVNELLPEDISSSEDIDRIFELLGEEDIRLVENEQAKEKEKQIEPPQKEAIDLEQFKPEKIFSPLDDPVKMYLKQMGSISLLSREHELDLAKKIEDAEVKFKRAALAAKFVRRQIINVANDILEEKINFEEVIKEDLKINKTRLFNRIRKVLERLKATKSEVKGIDLLTQLNFITSVIGVAVRKLVNLLRELNYIEKNKKLIGRKARAKRNKLNYRKRLILKELAEPILKIR